ncbi:MAG: transcription antitermination factor NusB [Candidatus Cloacimonetes bacterium]|nr:transcription antitermination factor NusB [Candidatus Cloacimonadota bacterium]MBL7107774.1 transcription antitermination factor NusB [Candidatus Cloacimonadota bacterium]
MGLRHDARELAVQTLFALFFDEEKQSAETIKNRIAQIIDFQDKSFTNQQNKFIEMLVKNTYKNLESIDELIKRFLKNWDFKRISVMDKMILRLAIMEMEFTETSPKIIINEAIEIAKKFCGDKSGKFINGILDAVMHREKNDKM